MRMVRSFFSTGFFSTVVLIATILLFTSCATNSLTVGIVPTMDINVQVSPLRYTASTDTEGGVSFESDDVSITVSAKPGSVGGYINSYSIVYAFADGASVSAGSSTVRSGGLGLRVQPGVSCATSGEAGTESATDCSVSTSKANFAPGAAATASGVQGVPAEIAYYYWCNYRVDVGAKALLTLSGVSDLGQAFTWRDEVAIDSNGSFLPANLSKPSICEGA